MHTVSRFGNIARAAVHQQSTCERLVGIRFASKKRRDDCLEKKVSVSEKKTEEVKQKEDCVDLNFKKKEVNIYNLDHCMPPKIPLDKDCSTVKAKKVSCDTKKRNIPTGCRKYSMYSRVQKSFQDSHYKAAGFNKSRMNDGTDCLYKTKRRCESCGGNDGLVQKSCGAPSAPKTTEQENKTGQQST